jgi:hypothetical protein
MPLKIRRTTRTRPRRAKPRVWNRRDPETPTDAVYVGRPTKWGNPFTVAEHGRGKCIQKFIAWVLHPDQRALCMDARRELQGRHLVCWCAPRECHADIWLIIANVPDFDMFLIGYNYEP